MTYVLGPRAVPKKTRIHELTLSSSQTVNSGDVIKFDTLRSTSSGGVSNNSTTGEITLSSSYRYTLIASLDVSRASITNSVRVAWFDGATELVASTGGYAATWTYHASSATNNLTNNTMQAWYVPAGAPASPVTLKVFDVGNNSTINTSMSVLVIETEV